MVNFDAGADTQMASIFTAAGIALAALLFTPTLYFLPKAVLAATIIVAVLALIDWNILKLSARFSRADLSAVLLTILVTLVAGVELGVLTGVGVSSGLHLYQSSTPHFAVGGQMRDSEHYRNEKRHDVITTPEILSIRIDESLYFANAAYLEDVLFEEVKGKPDLRHVVLMCPAVNRIDVSALEALERINERLAEQEITPHMSEVKGPVMDALQRSDFLHHLTGQIYLSQHAADLDLQGSTQLIQSAYATRSLSHLQRITSGNVRSEYLQELLVLPSLHKSPDAPLDGRLGGHPQSLLPATLAPISHLDQIMTRAPLH